MVVVASGGGGAAGWIFVIKRGGSGVGMEPAQTRWRKALMSRGVGFRACSPSSMVGGGGRSGNVEMGGVLVVVFALGGADGVQVSGLFCVGVIVAEWFLACVFAGFSEPGLVTGSETVGLSAVGDTLVGVLADVLMPVELVFALPLTTLSSSSDEMSTTIWADIIGCRPSVRISDLEVQDSSNESEVCMQKLLKDRCSDIVKGGVACLS